jgi:hypothetical protein
MSGHGASERAGEGGRISAVVKAVADLLLPQARYSNHVERGGIRDHIRWQRARFGPG